ncbi:winged helix-turn-helix transcriptional regulator [Candidatus Acetothermia bacterium]|nr:winged helix-turn-helix transcriptional regulator [Candidatus Acetothermia bacterium]
MGVRAKFVIAVAVTATVIVLLMGGFWGYRYAQDLESRVVTESISNANVVADIVTRYFIIKPTPTLQDLRDLQNFIPMEDKFYAQVFTEGNLIFVSGDDALVKRTPEPESFSERLWLAKQVKPDGTPYLDIIRVLDLKSPPDQNIHKNYIRLGFSLTQVSNQINLQIAQITLIGLAIIVVMALSAYLLSGVWFKTSPAATVSVPLTSTSIAPSLNEAKTPRDGVYLRIREIEIDEKSKQVRRAGQIVAISPREFALLSLLASDPGRVFSSDEILKSAWGDGTYLTAEDVKKYIYQLRQKLELNPENPQLIVTIRGFGYKISPP